MRLSINYYLLSIIYQLNTFAGYGKEKKFANFFLMDGMKINTKAENIRPCDFYTFFFFWGG